MDLIDSLELLLKSSRPYGIRLVSVSPDGERQFQHLAARLVECGLLLEADTLRFVRTVTNLSVDGSKEPFKHFAQELSATTTMVRDPLA